MRSLFLVLMLVVAGCAVPEPPPVTEVTTMPVVQTGAQVWASDGFKALKGKRVGLVVNHTARIDSVHLIDALHGAEGVTLTALFGPEHGLRGTADAGQKVEDGIDDATGTPIYSLYGSQRKPSPESLDSVDVLVFDIQDVGVRFYTYISTMGYAMQAANEAGIPFVVLDRPNPLGGLNVAGYIRESEFTSFVGQYPIPIVHGMTVGELARMVQMKGMMEGLEGLELDVVPMQGWHRGMRWPATGLPWIATSPNIPDFETAMVYPGTCFFEATATVTEGRGTRTPFKLIGGPWVDGDSLAAALEEKRLPGVRFAPAAFMPESMPGMASSPRFQDEGLTGVTVTVDDVDTYRPLETGIYMLSTLYRMSPEPDAMVNERWLARLAGTNRLLDALKSDMTPEEIVSSWAEEVEAFKEARAPFLLYP